MMKRWVKIASFLFIALLFLIRCYPTSTNRFKPVEQKSAFRFYENALIDKFDGRWTRALEQINRAIALNNRISLFFVLKAQILDSLHQIDSAIYTYKQALSIRPHAPDVLQKIGALYIEKGQPLKGVFYLKKAFAYDETQTDILLRIAKLYIALDSLRWADRVLMDYKVRTDLTGRSPAAAYYLMKANMAYKRKNYALAARYYALCPCKKCFTRTEALRAFETLLRYKKISDYFALLTGLETHKFKNGELFYYRGLYYKVIGNLNEARHQFELALAQGNTKPELFWELAQIYYRMNNTSAIRILYRRLKALDAQSNFLPKIRALF